MQSTTASVESFLATKYLGASLTVLIYDHLLLFGREVRCIWKADSSWFKWLFLYNHYSVPVYIIISALALGSIIDSTLIFIIQFCKIWLAITAILPISSLGIVNIFVAQRIYILWGLNKTVLKLVCFGVVSAYISCFVLTAIGVAQSSHFIVYDSTLKTCVPQRISGLMPIGFGVPLYLELMNFILLCCNALQRPRHLQTYIIKQLYLDGVMYFAVITVLRIANVLAVAGALSQENRLLFPLLLWSMIPAIVHRMILTLNDNTDDAEPNENGTEHLGLYVEGTWFSPSPVDLRTLSSNTSSSHFSVVEETYTVTDAIF